MSRAPLTDGQFHVAMEATCQLTDVMEVKRRAMILITQELTARHPALQESVDALLNRLNKRDGRARSTLPPATLE